MEFIASGLLKKGGIVVYAKPNLEPKMLFKDEDSRIMGVEITYERGKLIIIWVYAPNDKKSRVLPKVRGKDVGLQ